MLLPPARATVPVLTVTQVTSQVKDVLEQTFVEVWVVGEISNYRPASSGHLYFNLKDKASLLHMVMWRSDALRLRFKLQDGMEVIARGRLTVYPPRGDFQLTIDRLIPRGAGEQDLALRQLKEKLQALGYFAAERKKPIPAYPRRLALVTSPTGAAIRDMLEILGRRWPQAEVLVCGVRVQGLGAAQDMARALEQLNRLGQVDSILLGRGGGSTEDLAAFNEEILARAIFASRIPIISAVGHEIDVTIADLVADRRALTPSEAAELATPDCEKLARMLEQQAERLHNLMRGRLQDHRKKMQSLLDRRVLRQPRERVREQQHHVDELGLKLAAGMRRHLDKTRLGLGNRAAQLQTLSPLNVLARGYSLTRTETGKHVIRSVDQVGVGDAVEVLLHDGRLLTRVERTLPPDPLLQPQGVLAHE